MNETFTPDDYMSQDAEVISLVYDSTPPEDRSLRDYVVLRMHFVLQQEGFKVFPDLQQPLKDVPAFASDLVCRPIRPTLWLCDECKERAGQLEYVCKCKKWKATTCGSRECVQADLERLECRKC